MIRVKYLRKIFLLRAGWVGIKHRRVIPIENAENVDAAGDENFDNDDANVNDIADADDANSPNEAVKRKQVLGKGFLYF